MADPIDKQRAEVLAKLRAANMQTSIYYEILRFPEPKVCRVCTHQQITMIANETECMCVRCWLAGDDVAGHVDESTGVYVHVRDEAEQNITCTCGATPTRIVVGGTAVSKGFTPNFIHPWEVAYEFFPIWAVCPTCFTRACFEDQLRKL